MKKMIDRITIGMFAFILGGLFIMNILRPIRSFSPNENRVLAQFPEFSLKKLLNHEFTSNYETFITDQFAGRDQWVAAKTSMERLLGKVENNGVYFGKDDTLIEKLDAVDAALVDKNVRYVNQFADALDQQVKIDMMLIPGAAAIQKAKLPWISDDIDQLALIDDIQSKLTSRINFVNVNESFLAHAEEDLYFRTDHHYSIVGAGLAYQCYAEALGLPISDSYVYEVVADDFLGTLASQSGAYGIKPDVIIKLINDESITVTYPDTGLIDNNVYLEDNLKVKDKYTYYLNGNHSLVQIKTKADRHEKLLILRDSYANIFTPYLLQAFSEIDLLDLRYYKYSISEYIDEHEIDRVLILYSGKNFMSDVNFTFLK